MDCDIDYQSKSLSMIFGKTLILSTWSREETDSIGSKRLSHYDLRHGLTKCEKKTAQIIKKNGFTIKNEIEAERLSRPKSKGILTALRCISGSNLVILAWTGDKLLCGQAQNGINLVFQVKFDLEDQDRTTPKTICFLTILRCVSGPNLVILT